jgi:hypothetical protein
VLYFTIVVDYLAHVDTLYTTMEIS